MFICSHSYTGLVPQSFSSAVAEEGKGLCLEAERQSWCCPRMPCEVEQSLSETGGDVGEDLLLQDPLSPQLLGLSLSPWPHLQK